ncbi:MAG: FAD-dependent oxidoreductase [Candidatus Nezhaarchaeales archaeon]
MISADVVVIGSGAGGSIASLELTRQGFKVILLEEGEKVDLKNSYKSYSSVLSSIEILRAKCLGGSTLVSLGNMMFDDVMLNKLKSHGIDLTEEVRIIRQLMHVTEIPLHMLPPFAMNFINAAEEKGLNPRIMPKSIRYDRCSACGRCAYGCPNNAKYTAVDLIRLGEEQGLNVITGLKVEKIHKYPSNDEIIVEGIRHGEKLRANCRALIIAAGALETPRLLAQIHDNEKIGQNLFIDPFITVGGPYDGPSSNKGIQMAAYVDCGNFLLSPHYSGLLPFQLKVKGVECEGKQIASIMVKIADQGEGRVWSNGIVEARMTKKDLETLKRGIKQAREILIELGVKENEIAITSIRGAHPGGTAAIGYVVSRDLTINSCDGVFVADASLIPPPLGKPPIMLIMALALKVSHRVCEYLRR